MKLSDFDFDLPRELVAQYPEKNRELARLIVVERASGNIRHCIFKDVKEFIVKGDVLVINDTKVVPARLKGKRKTGGNVEILLLKNKGSSVFDCMIKPSRLKLNEQIFFNGHLTGSITSRNEITFAVQDISEVYGQGKMPLPPYIKREADENDDIYYQTVYASNEGAIASPTAGLHFSLNLLQEIKEKGVSVANITLHVGPGTFKPVKSEDITRHEMAPEYFHIPAPSEALIEEARVQKKRIFAVGTTSLRALETYARGKNSGFTDLFIYPGFEFKAADCLLTNFHLPRTTLFMLVCAFCGKELAKKAYQEAIKEKYRFYSYGDAMLII